MFVAVDINWASLLEEMSFLLAFSKGMHTHVLIVDQCNQQEAFRASALAKFSKCIFFADLLCNTAAKGISAFTFKDLKLIYDVCFFVWQKKVQYKMCHISGRQFPDHVSLEITASPQS